MASYHLSGEFLRTWRQNPSLSDSRSCTDLLTLIPREQGRAMDPRAMLLKPKAHTSTQFGASPSQRA